MNGVTARVFLPETRASDCYDWITAEDVVRHALAAYYVACRMCDPAKYEPADTPESERALPWSEEKAGSREGFAQHLTDHFLDRVDRHWREVGLGVRLESDAATRIEAIYPSSPLLAS